MKLGTMQFKAWHGNSKGEAIQKSRETRLAAFQCYLPSSIISLVNTGTSQKYVCSSPFSSFINLWYSLTKKTSGFHVLLYCPSQIIVLIKLVSEWFSTGVLS